MDILSFCDEVLPEVSFTNDQRTALKEISDWLDNPEDEFILAGFAGTGKSFLIKIVNQYLFYKKANIVNCSFTGKAVEVLRKQNMPFPSQTIHSTIYKPIEYIEEETGLRKLMWQRQAVLPFDLVIIDEVSMVGKEIYEDLKSYNVPMLMFGDSFQLGPVDSSEKDFNLLSRANFTMKEIVRNAADSNIIILSALLRNYDDIPCINRPDFYKGPLTDEITSLMMQSKENPEIQILTAYNKDRIKYNNMVACDIMPSFQPGDRIMNLENNRTHGIFNGQQGIIKSIKQQDEDLYRLQVEFFNTGRVIESLAFNNDGMLTLQDKQKLVKAGCLKLCHSWVCTTHKSQGSQWDTVIVVVPSWFHQNSDEYRWLYTSITRAVKKVYVVEP